ncbi:uncharacterized protein LOC109821533 [Asparagus officinalis]|uniref:uncharacterized protein LOC109821533 n=1 Tax=Asparagus officinalis TaxID=4686 RepID=UPI00098E3863|nr:uncharacterized protein LOC109821533 [Asparagus officinalis]
MNLTFWNVRGLNKSSKKHLIKHHLYQYKSSFIALLETKIRETKISYTAQKIARNWKWTSNVRNAGKARIIIMWDPDILEVQPIDSSEQHIKSRVQSVDGRINCVISAIYGLNVNEARKDLWMELSHMKQSIGNLPWLLCGDFNAMITSEEKLGGSQLSEADTKDFRDFIEVSLLTHLKTLGCFFTWNNKQNAESRVWSRLDRALVNDEWISSYSASHVEFLLPNFSDHSPAQISIYDDSTQGKKPFKFFKMWTNHPSYEAAVSDIWKVPIQGCKMFSICKKLKMLKGSLKDLNKKHFYNIGEQVQRAKIALENTQRDLQAQPLNPVLIAQEKECISKYNRLLDCELSFHQQKARINWNIHGDRCTRFFHNITKSRNHNNRVVILYNNLGEKITEAEGIVEELLSFYKNLMGTAVNTTPPDMNIIKNGPCLSTSQANALISPVTKEEIKDAIFSISENKAPGPDGYSMSFYKTAYQ